MNSAMVARYAEALYQAASRADALEAVSQDLTLVDQIVRADDRVFARLGDAAVPTHVRRAAIETALAERMHPLTYRTLQICLARGRAEVPPLLPAAFRAIVKHHSELVHARVVSARALDPQTRAAVHSRLTKRVGHPVEVVFDTDRRLGGGLRITYGDTMIDSSLASSLRRLRRRMLHQPSFQNNSLTAGTES